MRGILQQLLFVNFDSGITPAHAGNTISATIFLRLLGDHPRACGEYQEKLLHKIGVVGSPPRMRGIH